MSRLNKMSLVKVITAILFLQLLYSCSKQKEEFNTNLRTSIVEKTLLGSQKTTTIEYKNMGEGEGSDGVFGTGDDDVYRYFVIKEGEYVVDSNNDVEVTVSNSPGKDDIWFTADDEVEFLGQLEKSDIDAKYFVRFRSFTNGFDDGTEHNVRELSNREVAEYLILGVSPGSIEAEFNVFQTSSELYDDFYISNGGSYYSHWNSELYKKYTINGSEYTIFYYPYGRVNSYPYGEPHYLKDTIDLVTGDLISIEYSSPGNDGVWYTADDFFTQYSVTSGVDDPLNSTVNYFSGPGADSEWFTNDDLNSRREIRTFVADGNLSSYQERRPRNGSIIDMADDYVESYKQSHIIEGDSHIVLTKSVENLGLENEFIKGVDITKYLSGDGDSSAAKVVLSGSAYSGYLDITQFGLIIKQLGDKTIAVDQVREYGLSSSIINLVDIDAQVGSLIDEALVAEPYYGHEKTILVKEKLAENTIKTNGEFYAGSFLRGELTHIQITK